MAQALYCPSCKATFPPDYGRKACMACGTELIHGRIPAGRSKVDVRGRSTGGVGRAVWDHIIKRDPCVYCGVRLPPREITIDHIEPKALGGSKGSWTNRAGSCRPCNRDKAHTPLLFFLLQHVGEDISSLLDEEGDWPIPNETPEERAVRMAAESSEPDPGDPRAILNQMRGWGPKKES